MISTPGFVGVSTNISQVFVLTALSQFSVSSKSTKIVSIPQEGNILVKILWVDPKTERQART